jgi:SAM-dependent methyltransferase
MKKIFRNKTNEKYWDDRWTESGVDESHFSNRAIYPICYADKIINQGDTFLEAGCGAGRLYFQYKSEGKNIYGIEYSQTAIDNITKKDSSSQVVQGSITKLPYENDFFDGIMAFGLYHNIENEKEVSQAFIESSRVLKPSGQIVFSVRYDSFENNLIESIVRKRGLDQTWDKFHRNHFSLSDITKYLSINNIDIIDITYARNVSFLFKYNFFRSNKMKTKNFKEASARSSGFELNFFGKTLDTILHKAMPKLFSNLLVVIGQKR